MHELCKGSSSRKDWERRNEHKCCEVLADSDFHNAREYSTRFVFEESGKNKFNFFVKTIMQKKKVVCFSQTTFLFKFDSFSLLFIFH
jgi:hypothetical protein